MAVASSSTVSAANTAAVATITGQPGQVARLYRVDAFVSAGSSTITVADGSTTIWRSTTGEVTGTRLVIVWTPQPLMAQPGNNLVVTASAAGAGNTVTLNVEAEVR